MRPGAVEILHTEALPCGYTLRFVKTREDGRYPALPLPQLLVIDDRGAADPSFRLVDSCRIVRRRAKREILRAVMDYDARFPLDPPWRRTLRSMEKEWMIHNVAWRLGLCAESARHVDLNNAEEGRGWRHFFRRGIALAARRLLRRLRRRTAADGETGR